MSCRFPRSNTDDRPRNRWELGSFAQVFAEVLATGQKRGHVNAGVTSRNHATDRNARIALQAQVLCHRSTGGTDNVAEPLFCVRPETDDGERVEFSGCAWRRNSLLHARYPLWSVDGRCVFRTSPDDFCDQIPMWINRLLRRSLPCIYSGTSKRWFVWTNENQNIQHNRQPPRRLAPHRPNIGVRVTLPAASPGRLRLLKSVSHQRRPARRVVVTFQTQTIQTRQTCC